MDLSFGGTILNPKSCEGSARAHLLQQEYAAQAILDRLIGGAGTARDAHDQLPVLVLDILDERFRHNLSGHGAVRDGVVGTDAVRLVDVERANACLLRDFEEVGSVGGIPPSDDKDEVQAEAVRILN